MSAKRYIPQTVSRSRMYEVIRAPLITEKTTNGSEHSQVTFKVAADATRLPFGDGVFDAVTISFGLRNIVDHVAGLREMARVTRPGGRLVVCEFSTPTVTVLATAYKEYLMRALPRVARAMSSNPEAYEYLAESIRVWPDQPTLAGQIGEAGWAQARWRNLTGGIVALHAAMKPASPSENLTS